MTNPAEPLRQALERVAQRFPDKVRVVGPTTLEDIETGALYTPTDEADALAWIAAGESDD